MRPLTLFAVTLVVVAAFIGGEARGQETEGPRFPLVFHIATDDQGRPVYAEESLQARVDDAARRFAAAGIDFHIHDVRTLPAEYEVLDTIRERRALRRYFEQRVINVFVTGAIHDPHPSAATVRAAAAQGRAPTGWISGAHIPSGRGRRPDTYIVLSARTDLWSLPHELGHFFGAAHHSDPNNIMSYGVGRRVFDEAQLTRFRRNRARLVRRRLLRPMLPPRALPTAPSQPAGEG